MSISFFLVHQEEGFSLNLDIFETNLVNIFLLIALVIYVKLTVLDPGLKQRQEDIYRQIENTKKDIFNATEYYYVSEQAFSQNTFWLQSWQNFYEQEKHTILEQINSKTYLFVNSSINLTQNIVTTIEKKAFLSLQKYILYLVTAKILRKFLKLSEKEQSELIEITLVKLRGE
jgi:F-type H+-transporting ATPase subunit b